MRACFPGWLGLDSRSLAIKALCALALLVPTLAFSCDQDAQAVFRQSATGSVGQGVKEFLGGDAEQAVNTIVSAAVDGVVASIEQAGDGPGTGK